MTDTDDSEPETIRTEFTLDAAHEEMVAQLRDAGVPVEQALAQQLQAAAENTVHELFQASKYQEE